MYEKSYSPVMVERLCRSYLDHRHSLFGSAQRLPDSTIVDKPEATTRELPFGMRRGDSPWPFFEPIHAKPKVDGKRKADLATSLWVSMMDLEAGLKKLSDDDIGLVYKYHIFQTRTLDELAVEIGIKSRSAVSARVQRAVARLTHLMNGGVANDAWG